jgi:hypothetical protein
MLGFADIGHFFSPRTRLNRVRVNRGAVEGFKPINLKDFLALDIPARASLLHPILPEKGLAICGVLIQH